MRNVILLNNVDASNQNISNPVNFEKRTDWKLIIESFGLVGTPQLFIEEAFTSGKCEEPTEWFVLNNKCDNSGTFEIDSSLISIERNWFTGNWFRVRTEPNGTTSGTIKATIHYKDYP